MANGNYNNTGRMDNRLYNVEGRVERIESDIEKIKDSTTDFKTKITVLEKTVSDQDKKISSVHNIIRETNESLNRDMAKMETETRQEFSKYTTKDSFIPVRLLAYGLAAALLLAVISAILDKSI